jgi:hypothetical protein
VALTRSLALALSVLLTVTAGCKRKPKPEVAPTAAKPTASTLDAGIAAKAPLAAAAAAPVVEEPELPALPDPSPFRVVAVASNGARLHVLANGEVLYGRGLTLWKLRLDGTMQRFLDVDPGRDFHSETNPIGAYVGDTPDDALVSLSEGDPQSYSSRVLRVHDGHFTPVKNPGSWFYLQAARWKDNRVVALRANGAVRFEFSPTPWVADRLDVVKGAGTNLPLFPKGFFAKGFVAFDSGELFVAGNMGEAPSSAHGAYVVRATGAYVVLPGTDEDVVVQAICARNAHSVYVGGERNGKAYLAAWNGLAWYEERVDMPPITDLSVTLDGTLWAAVGSAMGDDTGETGALFSRPRDALLAEVPLPDLHAARFADPPPRISYLADRIRIDDRKTLLAAADKKKAPLVPRQVVARGPKDVWVLASRDGATYLLHSQTEGAAVDLDVEEARAGSPIISTRECKTTFIALGESSPEAITKLRVARDDPGAEALPRVPVVTARVDGALVLGAYFGVDADGARQFTESARSHGFVAKSTCGRPSIESLALR